MKSKEEFLGAPASSPASSEQPTGTSAVPGLVPKLRFPEFRDKPGWETKSLAPFLEEAGKRVSSETELPVYSSTRTGLKRQDDYYDGRVLLNKNDYGVVPVGCFVYRHMSDDGLFKFNINDTGEDIAVSKEYPVFRTVNLDPKFLLSKLNNGADFEEFAMSQKAGGTRTRLYFSKLSTWVTSIPSLAEQKEIAECLSTLDELIGAASQKLDALKAHKKGLMQQLFPREGETLPRLRFSEEGDWTVANLPEVTFFQEGPGIMAVDFHSEGVPLVRLSGVGGLAVTLDGCNYLDVKKVAQKWEHFRLAVGDLVISTSATFGRSSIVTEEAAGAVFYTGLIRFRPADKRLSRSYLETFLGSPAFLRQAESAAVGGGIKHFGPTHLKEMQIPLPSWNEQQLVASCLSSLDDLIAAQGDQLEALKTHKKGLMQQLFPSPAEAEA